MSGLLTNIIIQMIAGAFGGIVIGNVLTRCSLGTSGNTIVGALGGGLGGYVLSRLLPSLQNAASGIDWGAFLGLGSVSFICGAIVTVLAAVARDRTA